MVVGVIRFAKLQKIVAINQMRNVCSPSNTKEEHLINVQLTNGILKLGVQQKLMQMETSSVVNGENVTQTNVKKTQLALRPMDVAPGYVQIIGLAE